MSAVSVHCTTVVIVIINRGLCDHWRAAVRNFPVPFGFVMCTVAQPQRSYGVINPFCVYYFSVISKPTIYLSTVNYCAKKVQFLLYHSPFDVIKCVSSLAANMFDNNKKNFYSITMDTRLIIIARRDTGSVLDTNRYVRGLLGYGQIGRCLLWYIPFQYITTLVQCTGMLTVILHCCKFFLLCFIR